MRLKQLVDSLHDEGRYLGLMNLIDPYLPILKRASEKKLPVQALHEQIRMEYVAATSTGIERNLFASDRKTRVPKFIARRLKPLLWLIPSRRKATSAANDILEVILSSKPIRRILTRQKAEFALKLLELRFFFHTDFTDRYLRELIETPDSHFFIEIPANTTSEPQAGIYLDPKNTLLFGLLNDPNFTIQISAWKPIADAAIDMIRNDYVYKHTLNSPESGREGDLFDDPIFCVIHFFDIMVTRAAITNVKDHMWLMYMSIFVEELEQNHSPDLGLIDERAEFPTLGCRLIYEISYRLQSWINLTSRLPADNFHVSRLTPEQAEEGCIPFWAATDLCDSVRLIVESSRLPESFKVDRLSSFVRALAKLPDDGRLPFLPSYLSNGLVNGPHKGFHKDMTPQLKELSKHIDRHYLFETRELSDLLK